MAIKGERKWSSQGKETKKFEFTKVPAGDHEAKLDASGAAVAKAEVGKDGKAKFPYVKVRFEAMDTATTEGGKNGLLFHNLFCSLRPDKNGGLMPQRADQIVGLARALGEEYDGNVLEMKDEKGDIVEVLDPNEMVQWLKDHDGALLNLHVKMQKGTPEWPDEKSVISYFIEVEPNNAFSTGETAEEAEEEIEEEAEVEEVEEEPAPPPKKKAPLKVAPKRR
jgi:predicted RNase H-like HicB family nuclease